MVEINLGGVVYCTVGKGREWKGEGILGCFEHWRKVAEGCMWAIARRDLPERQSLLVDYDGCFVAAVSGVMGLLGRERSVGYRRFLVSMVTGSS